MDMLKAVAWLFLLTFVPGLELRASIPFGFFHESCASLGVPLVVAVCLAANVLVGLLTFWLMGPVVMVLRRWGWFEQRVWPHFAKTQHKLHPYVEKYGEWGLAVFIGVPLPGTGAYTGAFGAYLLGFDRRRFFIANLVGVLIACVCVTALCLLIQHGAVADESWLRRIFIKQV